MEIDYSLFLKDFKTFEQTVLPLLNKKRMEDGEPEYSDYEAMDRYLDMINELKELNGK